MRILGIDPGSRVTGYGVVDSDGRRSLWVDSGCLRVQGDGLPERLGCIFRRVQDLIREYRPEVMAIEQVFVSRNPDSALKLGQARGAAICAGVQEGLAVAEYGPRVIKQAVVGTGAATKEQMQHMVTLILSLSRRPATDAADALAVALCHAHTQATLARLPAALAGRGR
ncbi:Holliday junction endonuclease RuvC [Ectothiorhodospira mobilis]|uniref:Crossover junction endodeoxyribonuclease RuvC n=1 Tax=Ectothiorhodospira mobilis TaxID=195064 RepID=A0A1I4RD73_ECTMO|nr:crossover junction endodeoxyribonuclease RuvC [Ectothiorhodospira mobilis]SFM50155.1 Holliday junction endonuclease RuvC [Ectothiorhodospira mobilis]